MNLLLITGGKHPYEKTTPVLNDFLKEAGHTVTVSESGSELAGDLSAFDAIVLNTLRQPDTDNDLNEAERSGFENYVSRGGSLLSVHISAASCPAWAPMKKITGGGWVMGQSFHPPYSNFSVDVANGSHPCASSISAFNTDDELYMNIDYRDGNDVFITADFQGGAYGKNRAGAEEMEMEGGTFPLAWTRSYGAGKVFVTLLGHDGKSHQSQGFQKLVLNGVDWVTS